MDRSQVFQLINEHRETQENKHGQNPSRPYTLDRWCAILGEEMGEVCKAVVEVGYFQDKLAKPDRATFYPLQVDHQIIHCEKEWRSNLKSELLSVAAVAVAMLEELW